MTKRIEIEFKSSVEIMNTPMKKRRFIVDEMIYPGLHVLSGDPKIGKSWMMMDMCLAIAKGEKFLGRKTEQGHVVYMALEDTSDNLQTRMYELTDEPTDNLQYVLLVNTLGNGLEDDLRKCKETFSDLKLIVIDTLQKVRDTVDMKYGSDYKDVSTLKSIADELGIAIILVHYNRKQQDSNPNNMILGTNGIPGASDGCLVLQRNGDSNNAVLNISGRGAPSLDINVIRDGAKWKLLDKPPEDKPDNFPFVIHDFKRKQKWVSTGYEIRGNKKAAKAFLDELLVAYNKKQQAALKVISKMKHPEQFIKEQSRIMALPLFLYIEEWIEHSSAKLQPTTIDGYRQLCNGRIRTFFESRGTTVYDLTGEDLNEFYAYLAKQGLKGASQQRYHGLIHSAYSFLMKHQYIDSNPCDFADRPKAEKYRGAYYNQSELTELFRAAKESEIYIPVLLAAYYGLRRSEVLGIKWSNIDFENGTIRIAHKVVEQKVDGKYQTVGHDKMKTESSNRILPLMKEVAMALRRLKLHQEEQRQLCGNCYIHEYDDYVCVNEIEQLLRPNYISAKFSELLKENGLKHIRYHDLRHSCASLLLANGVPMKEIQEWLGHSNYRTTADVYSHLDFSSKEHSAEIISRVLAV